MATYGISITCVLCRRLTAPHLLPRSQWSLGRYGVLVNGVAVAYAWFTFFWYADAEIGSFLKRALTVLWEGCSGPTPHPSMSRA